VNIAGKVVVVTGASSGFGERIARKCAAQGASVVLAARSADTLDRLVSELGPQRALAVPTDVTSDEDVRRLVAATHERFGHADVLVNNAGFGILDRIADASFDDLHAMMDVNLYGAVRCANAFLPHMLARRSGQIINMASLAGFVATINMGFYSTTKFAIVGWSRTLMLELYGTGVRCALIAPGFALTNFMRRADINKYARVTQLATTTPDAVASAVVKAIQRGAHGEVILPWYGWLFTVASNMFPGLTRSMMRVVR
jgi:short-subunit dehydrogenase